MNNTPSNTPHPTLRTRGVWWYIATWFGSGLAPKASGTAGSLAALPFAFVIHYYVGNMALFIAAAAMFFIGWWASNQYLRHTGQDGDPKEIVVDEVAGMWFTLSFLPPNPTFKWYIGYFILFRFFDALKPWPISVADRKIKGGFGIMFDDILAAIFSIIAAWFVIMLWFF